MRKTKLDNLYIRVFYQLIYKPIKLENKIKSQ